MVFIFVFLLLFATLQAQQSPTIASIEQAYKNATLKYNSVNLLVTETDSPAEQAAKHYYNALVSPDFQNALLLHSVNFNTHPDEYYGQLSGIQLISIDFINKEYGKATQQINKINSVTVPEVQYWKAKVAFALQRYDEVITICNNFVTGYASHSLIPNMWVIILEALYHKNDRQSFERNFDIFARHSKFDEYKPYLLYLNGQLNEANDTQKAIRLYNQVVSEFTTSQYRVLAEDRLFALRHNTGSPATPEVTPPANTTFTNVVVSRYEALRKGAYYIQFGAYATEGRAKNHIKELSKAKISTFSITKPSGNTIWYCVIQGPYSSKRSAETAQQKINKKYPTFVFLAE